MTVESYLELFTTLFGWQQYNNLWGVLSDTGTMRGVAALGDPRPVRCPPRRSA